MPSSHFRTSCRDIFLVGVLIAGVCLLTLMPAMYLVFHALRWKGALRIVEAAFPAVLLVAIAGGLLAYQRARARRLLQGGDESHGKYP